MAARARLPLAALVGARDRHLHSQRVAVPETPGPVPRASAATPLVLAGRRRSPTPAPDSSRCRRPRLSAIVVQRDAALGIAARAFAARACRRGSPLACRRWRRRRGRARLVGRRLDRRDRAGAAPRSTYLAFACRARWRRRSGCARRQRSHAQGRRPGRPSSAGDLLVGIAASVFLPLKFAIPHEIPVLARPTARTRRAGDLRHPAVARARPRAGLGRGPDGLAVRRLAADPVCSSCSSSCCRARRRPNRALLIAYSLAWFLLGVVAAVAARLGRPDFLRPAVRRHDLRARWAKPCSRAAHGSRSPSPTRCGRRVAARPGAVAGISAMPSIHVAISVWIFLTARALAPRAAVRRAALRAAHLDRLGAARLALCQRRSGRSGRHDRRSGSSRDWSSPSVPLMPDAGNSSRRTHIPTAALTGCGTSR